MKFLKKFALSWINRMGYDLVRPSKEIRGFNAKHLQMIVTPATVFDIGVGFGTPPLYQAFPSAFFILVEPLREYETTIRKLEDSYNCRTYYNAVGSAEGRLEFTVDQSDPEKSSFAERSRVTSRNHAVEKRVVEVITLDRILAENPNIQQPILVKIDTEGHELEALKGATELLRVTDTVIAEVSVAKRFEGGYRFEDIILFMKENGFRLVDILSISHASGELEPRHLDIVFKKATVS